MSRTVRRSTDNASDIEPLRNLYKTEVYELAKHLGIPKKILEKPPTAGLWEGQTDEGEFGFTYKEADEALFQLYDQKKTNVKGIDPAVVAKVKTWVARNRFKRHTPLVS